MTNFDSWVKKCEIYKFIDGFVQSYYKIYQIIKLTTTVSADAAYKAAVEARLRSNIVNQFHTMLEWMSY